MRIFNKFIFSITKLLFYLILLLMISNDNNLIIEFIMMFCYEYLVVSMYLLYPQSADI